MLQQAEDVYTVMTASSFIPRELGNENRTALQSGMNHAARLGGRWTDVCVSGKKQLLPNVECCTDRHQDPADISTEELVTDWAIRRMNEHAQTTLSTHAHRSVPSYEDSSLYLVRAVRLAHFIPLARSLVADRPLEVSHLDAVVQLARPPRYGGGGAVDVAGK
jgi:hypothetical protein